MGKDINKLFDLPSRKAMTSGTLKEVSDKSVFIKYLNKRLVENPEKYITFEKMFSEFHTAVLIIAIMYPSTEPFSKQETKAENLFSLGNNL